MAWLKGSPLQSRAEWISALPRRARRRRQDTRRYVPISTPGSPASTRRRVTRVMPASTATWWAVILRRRRARRSRSPRPSSKAASWLAMSAKAAFGMDFFYPKWRKRSRELSNSRVADDWRSLQPNVPVAALGDDHCGDLHWILNQHARPVLDAVPAAQVRGASCVGRQHCSVTGRSSSTGQFTVSACYRSLGLPGGLRRQRPVLRCC